ncbi:unnamed protein product [Tilletia controversa]|uniref:ATP-dependent RNA helicase n=1 Tax=Tilletia controversa TaxID=13291 RepID=A0A8X7MLH1_9BASI|nr:hypothetical protein CF328_g4949 [Tilletia controversa]KAE8239506.1 hypothetical protein A4X06_0g8228 [Tilletia controversa]CAD6967314.1 unnamed protein product [Tilletia controversa]CAD6978319.1 unnamed protein product [Tilletia controversa]
MSAPNTGNRGGPSRSRGRGRNPNTNANTNIGRQMSSAPAVKQEVKQENVPPSVQTAVAPTVSTHLSNVRFDSLQGQVDARLLSAIAFPLMSEVQAATLVPALSGADILAQAKTGTGKTIAFLLPTISRILQRGAQAPSGSVSCLIMSPTRELALQIQREAEMLLKNVPGQIIGVQHVVGGTNMKTEERNLATKRCDILVATPGRLLDHLNNTSGMARKFSDLQAYILDEADRMLDMGFRQELAKIGQFLPDRNKVRRQALLFSATIPPGVREVANLDPNAQYINTLSEEEANTHAHVPQQSVVAGMPDLLPLTLALLLEELERAPTAAKVIVFSPTARAAGLFAEVFRTRAIADVFRQALGNTGTDFSIGEVHSRKSQPQRVKATQEFAAARRGVLFSSDVAARGVDFPGVTAVFQVGLPASPEQYIHRIGRTGRAGATGRGVIVLADFESYFLGKGEMRELPIQTHPGDNLKLDDSRRAILLALRDVSDESKAQAYQASLGYYKSEMRSLRWTPAELVSRMNDYAQHALLYDGGSGSASPPLLAKTVGKMGLRGTPGLNVVRELPEKQGQGHGQGQGQGRGQSRGGGPSRPGQGHGQGGNMGGGGGGGQGQGQDGRKPGFRGGNSGHRGGGGGSRGGATQ